MLFENYCIRLRNNLLEDFNFECLVPLQGLVVCSTLDTAFHQEAVRKHSKFCFSHLLGGLGSVRNFLEIRKHSLNSLSFDCIDVQHVCELVLEANCFLELILINLSIREIVKFLLESFLDKLQHFSRSLREKFWKLHSLHNFCHFLCAHVSRSIQLQSFFIARIQCQAFHLLDSFLNVTLMIEFASFKQVIHCSPIHSH